jgi:geranylgeranyl pyrophosphate synthase
VNPEPRLIDRRRRVEPPPAARFLGLIADKLAATEQVFRHHLASDVPFIDHAGEYLADSGGKRMRPALLLLTSRLLGHDGKRRSPTPRWWSSSTPRR